MFRARPNIDLDGEAQPLGPGHRVLAAVSGGADSVALLEILVRLKSRWDFELEVAHVHHGNSKSKVTQSFRRRAETKVAALCARHELRYELLRVKPLADSEEALRDVRFAALETAAAKSNCQILAMGHHADDLFETRLIRLIRGTGPIGITAMTVVGKTGRERVLWRPLLAASRAEIEIYLTEVGLQKNRDWIADPSNRDERYLRNAIRRRLVPMLEKIRPGGAASMARSLALFADFVDAQDVDAPKFDVRTNLATLAMAGEDVLDRAQLLKLDHAERRQCLAGWLRKRGVRGISKSQIEEILKRIDTPQKRLTFETGGRVWIVDGKSISLAVRLGPTSR